MIVTPEAIKSMTTLLATPRKPSYISTRMRTPHVRKLSAELI